MTIDPNDELFKAFEKARDALKDAAKISFTEGKKAALDTIDFLEAAASNDSHKWLPKSPAASGPFLLAVGIPLALVGIKGVAAFVGTRAVIAGGIALIGKGTAYRGFRAMYPREKVDETPPVAPSAP